MQKKQQQQSSEKNNYPLSVNTQDQWNFSNTKQAYSEIMQNLDSIANKHLNYFCNTLKQFLESVHMIWPDCMATEMSLNTLNTIINDEEITKLMIEDWYKQLKPQFKNCINHNALKVLNADIALIKTLDLITKYHEIENDEESINNLWEFIINLNKASLEYHNWSKDDLMNDTIKNVVCEIDNIDSEDLLNDSVQFGQLLTKVTSSMSDIKNHPEIALKMFKKIMVMSDQLSSTEGGSNNDKSFPSNFSDMTNSIPVDDSVKNMMLNLKTEFASNDDDIWDNLSEDETNEEESKTITQQRKKKY